MSTRVRYLLLLLLLTSATLAHGTEIAGMYTGTIASAVSTTIALVVLPFRPRRRFVAIASYPLSVVLACVAIGVLQNGINNTLGQSVWVWAVLSALLPLVLLGIVYYEFCRRGSPATPKDSKEEP